MMTSHCTLVTNDNEKVYQRANISLDSIDKLINEDYSPLPLHDYSPITTTTTTTINEEFNEDFYSLSCQTINGKTFEFSNLKNKVVLIINIATFCGFSFQINGFNKLYEKYPSLEIIGFLSNDFLQNPQDNSSSIKICESFYKIKFPIMARCKINGSKTHEVYKFLKNCPCPEQVKQLGFNSGNYGVGDDGCFSKKIFWNFEKFLINKNGEVLKRFHTLGLPHLVEKHIKELL